MKKILLVIGGIVVLAAVGFGVFTLTNDNSNNNEASNTSTETAEAENTNNQSFNPAAQTNEPFVATITTDANNKTLKGVMKSDGKGNVEYVGNISGNKSQLFFTKDAYYVCTNGTCLKFAASDVPNAGIDPDQYQYDQSQIDAWRNASTYQGQQDCGEATCDVWKTNSDKGNVTIFVDSSTKKIVKVVTEVEGGTSTIEYEYEAVTIKIPTNAKTLPTAN